MMVTKLGEHSKANREDNGSAGNRSTPHTCDRAGPRPANCSPIFGSPDSTHLNTLGWNRCLGGPRTTKCSPNFGSNDPKLAKAKASNPKTLPETTAPETCRKEKATADEGDTLHGSFNFAKRQGKTIFNHFKCPRAEPLAGRPPDGKTLANFLIGGSEHSHS